MNLWTIQPIFFWDRLQKDQSVIADSLSVEENHPGLYHDVYQWLISKMNKTSIHRSLNHKYPLWAWYRWNGRNDPRPDLRVFRWSYPKGVKFIRIEFEIPEDHVLLFDHQLWLWILSGSYIPISRKDSVDFDNEFNKREIIRKEHVFNRPEFDGMKKKIIKSWDRIFDLKNKSWIYQGMNQQICAVFWELKSEWVTNASFFEGAFID